MGMGKLLAAGGLVVGTFAAGPLLAQDRTVALDPPPPVMIAPAPPSYQSTRSARYVPVALDVELVAGGSPLWQGTLRLGDYNASYNQSLNQAPELCPQDNTGLPRFSSTTQSLRVNVTRRVVGNTTDGQFNVGISWTRPGPPCEGGVSTVSFDRTVSLKPGATVELAGDAGLVVRISRKK
jgi:hypothetical protein